MSNPLNLEEVQARENAAFAELIRILSLNIKPRMSIPANPSRETAMLIGDSLADIPKLLAEVTDLRTQLAEAEADFATARRLHDYTHPKICRALNGTYRVSRSQVPPTPDNDVCECGRHELTGDRQMTHAEWEELVAFHERKHAKSPAVPPTERPEE